MKGAGWWRHSFLFFIKCRRPGAVDATGGAVAAFDPNGTGIAYALAVAGPAVYAGVG